MKKICLIIFTLLISFLPLFAKISFADLDLSSDNKLIFTAQHSIPSSPSYKTLFLTNLNKTGIPSSYQVLTCFPEKMELINQGKRLMIRNRYGNAIYNISNSSLQWISNADKIPVEYIHTGAYSVSPNGNWICYVNQTKNTLGQLILLNTSSFEQVILQENYSFSYDKVNIKWSNSGNTLIYEKDDCIYFYTPEVSQKNISIPENYRKIGEGNIRSVQWTKDNNLLYIDSDIIYKIREKELYTRGLYSSLVGKGAIIGRLPYVFNQNQDDFYCSEDGNEIAVVSNKSFVSCYSINRESYNYITLNGVYHFSQLKGSPLYYDILWTNENKPLLWVDILQYETGKKYSSVYTIHGQMNLLMDVQNSSRPIISPDGKKIAFTTGKNIYVYDISTWTMLAKNSGEKIHSFLWNTNSSLYLGGEETVRYWNIDYKDESYNTKILFLSSAVKSYFDAGRIICKIDYLKKNFIYNPAKNTWNEIHLQSSLIERKEKNSNFRVFTGSSSNSNFENGIYVRSLNGKVITYPIFKEVELNVKNKPKVALIFDAMNNAEGVSSVISVLKEFGIEGTFFVNGEFIRRYPVETKQIVASGFECGSSFYSDADLLSKNIMITEDFIKRGLARNEDEFYLLTGKELSLIWHAPWYKDNALMRKAGNDAGYKYVQAFNKYSDKVSFEQSTKKGSKEVYYSANELIDNIVASLYDGMIIPINVGKISGSRKDYLYENLDLLIAAILDSGAEITNLRELLN